MAQDSGKVAGNVSQSFVDIGITDAACVHFHQDLGRAGLGMRNIFDLPATALGRYNSSLHICFLLRDSMHQFENGAHLFLLRLLVYSSLYETVRAVYAG